MPIMDHFGWLAPYYDHLITSNNRDMWTRLLDPIEGALLLDAGGGTGRVVEWLASDWCKAIVVDESFKMLRQAATKPGLMTLQSTVEGLPFPPGSFDRVIMVDVLHHVKNQAATAAELFRILKPGGTLVIEEPDIRYFRVKLIAIAEKLALMRSHFLPPNRIAELFKGMPAHVTMEFEPPNTFIVIKRLENV
jgi:ubiquinone/menaquinone biosynthesis C-methylase UbiE